jgi:DNA-binding NarL/FixJ family response regulator
MVASQPRLMREVVLEVISGQPDIEVVAEVQDDSKIVDLVGDLRPDWLVIALDEPDCRPIICVPLFDRYPNLKILTLASKNNDCIFYWATMSIRSSRVESSEKGILDALRGRRPVSDSVFDRRSKRTVN